MRDTTALLGLAIVAIVLALCVWLVAPPPSTWYQLICRDNGPTAQICVYERNTP